MILQRYLDGVAGGQDLVVPTKLRELVASLLGPGGPRRVLLLAHAGDGKSHLLNQLRREVEARALDLVDYGNQVDRRDPAGWSERTLVLLNPPYSPPEGWRTPRAPGRTRLQHNVHQFPGAPPWVNRTQCPAQASTVPFVSRLDPSA